MTGGTHHLAYLENCLRARVKKNSRYSLRAFAKDLGMDASQLSKTLAGKLPLTLKRAGLILERLKIPTDEADFFLRSIVQTQVSQPQNQVEQVRTSAHHEKTLDYDVFQTISDLKHFAILELTYLDSFKPTPRWIAKRLGITVIEAETALTRLLRLGILKRHQNTMVKTDKNISTGYREVSSAALKSHHAQVLREARKSLQRDNPDIRNNHSITLAADEKKIKAVRAMTIKFLNELVHLLESGKPTKLYQISFSLFPLHLGEKL